MTPRTTTLVGVLAVGVAGGVAMYASQFLGPGSSPAAVQLTQLVREVVSTAVLVAAALAGFSLYDGDAVRRSAATVLAAFLVSGLVGYGVGLVALSVAPPARFALGSFGVTALLVALQEVVPFALAGFSGAALRAFRDAGLG